MIKGTHKRRLRGGDETRWASDGASEGDRFRFRDAWEASSSLSSESEECVREGVADRLRVGGDGWNAISWMAGDGGV